MTRAFALKRQMIGGIWVTLATLVIGAPAPAKAGPDLGTGSPDDVKFSEAPAGQENKDHWMLGAAVAAVPRFEGSDEYEAQPVPLIDMQYGRFFARTGEGIGANVIDTPAFTAGASIDWMKGYSEKDVPAGIRGVKDALGARLFVSARFEGVVATLASTQAVTESDRGLLVNAGLSYPIHATDRLTITPSLGTTWANEKYMNSYFGVDTSEAVASGLNRYQPTSGFKDVSLRVGTRYRITDSISVVSSVGVIHLLGEAADSPLVVKQTQPIALMGLTYAF